jgi:hypothetical protein
MEKALKPEDLAVFFVNRANAGDVEGIVTLYESDAILVINKEGKVAKGHPEIRIFYAELLNKNIKFEQGRQSPALRNEGLALTSSRLVNGIVTSEVARIQPDGTWLWIIDQPANAMELHREQFRTDKTKNHNNTIL